LRYSDLELPASSSLYSIFYHFWIPTSLIRITSTLNVIISRASFLTWLFFRIIGTFLFIQYNIMLWCMLIKYCSCDSRPIKFFLFINNHHFIILQEVSSLLFKSILPIIIWGWTFWKFKIYRFLLRFWFWGFSRITNFMIIIVVMLLFHFYLSKSRLKEIIFNNFIEYKMLYYSKFH
jgi:hypothetical protein